MVSAVGLVNAQGGKAILVSNDSPNTTTVKMPTVSGTLAVEGVTSGIPAGTVVFGAYQTAPDGWLICDGSTVASATYENLFAAIGTTFGGDATNFKLPDLKGVFIRGWSGPGPSVVDPSRVFGSLQQDTFESHTHIDSGHTHSDAGHSHTDAGHGHTFDGAACAVDPNVQSGSTFTSAVPGGGGVGTGYSNIQASAANIQTSTANITVTGGTETRPTNVALLPIIKY